MGSHARITDTARKGDLRIAFGFERQDDGRTEPVMYIYCARSPRQVAYVAIRNMYLFDPRERERNGTLTALKHAKTLAEAVYGGTPSQMEVHRCLDAVTDFMQDLKDMPPPSTLRNPDHLERVLAQHGYDMVR